jgi:hypothetical protein
MSSPTRLRFGPFAVLALVLAVLWPTAAAHAGAKPLTPEEQDQVNKAIDRGVSFLKQTQTAAGPWVEKEGSHPIGYAALPGLTLLECGVRPDDPAVQRVAQLIRRAAPNIDRTYELALSILFLDKLGDSKDRKLIQMFALRLVAGQSPTGGWGYKCAALKQPRTDELLAVLRATEPSVPAELTTNRPNVGSSNPADLNPDKVTPTSGSRPADLDANGSSGSIGDIEAARANAKAPWDESRRSPRFAWCIKAQEPPPYSPINPFDKKDADQPKKPFVIPNHLRNLVVFQKIDRLIMIDPPNKGEDLILATTDNSNTQFALLGLWAARRHDVPLSRTLKLIVRRFETSQNPNGSWGYNYRPNPPQEGPAMTAVGLIGMAVGHALDENHQPVKDPRIVNGFTALSQHVGEPVQRWQNVPQTNLYMLWSIERVSVLYNLPEIGGKDWYRWGAEMLIANQSPLGAWEKGGYHQNSAVIDTCFALLFLKRANFVKDLTTRLEIDSAALQRDIIAKLAAEKKTAEAKKSPPPEAAPEKPEAAPEKPEEKAPEPASKDSSKPAEFRPSSSGSTSGQTGGASEKKKTGGTEPSGGSALWPLLLAAVGVLLLGGGLAMVLLRRGGETE